jgi:hypothetical protein
MAPTKIEEAQRELHTAIDRVRGAADITGSTTATVLAPIYRAMAFLSESAHEQGPYCSLCGVIRSNPLHEARGCYKAPAQPEMDEVARAHEAHNENLALESYQTDLRIAGLELDQRTASGFIAGYRTAVGERRRAIPGTGE